MASLTQLRTSFGGVIGLDYGAVKIVADSLKITLDENTLKAIAVCEQELLTVITERTGKNAEKNTRRNT